MLSFTGLTLSQELHKNTAKTVAGFLNSDGGVLLIGVLDDGTIYGIENDIKTLGRKDKDGFEQTLVQIAADYLGAEFYQYIKISFQEKEAKTICVVNIDRSPTNAAAGSGFCFLQNRPCPACIQEAG